MRVFDVEAQDALLRILERRPTLTDEQIAQRLGWSLRTIRRWRARLGLLRATGRYGGLPGSGGAAQWDLQARVIALHLDDLGPTEIAACVGITPKAATLRIVRARKAGRLPT